MLELLRHDRVARVTLDRPPVNAINDEWLANFNRLLDELDCARFASLSVVVEERHLSLDFVSLKGA